MERVVSTKLPAKAEPTQPPIKAEMRDRLFALEYVRNGGNGTKAAIAAGCPAKTARTQGSQWLAKLSVQRRIAELRKRVETKTEVTIENLVAELGKVAFASMENYVTVDVMGEPQVDLSALTPAQWAAIGEITIEEYKEGAGPNARDVKRTKFKLHDKLAAIDKAMRHLGGYKKDGGSAGDGDSGAGNNTTVYTLNIGTANIMVRKEEAQPLPRMLER